MQDFVVICFAKLVSWRPKPSFRVLAYAFAAVLVAVLPPKPASANGIIVNDAAPNWALGAPQYPAIGACSDGVIGGVAFNLKTAVGRFTYDENRAFS